jgi:hypothetical protein
MIINGQFIKENPPKIGQMYDVTRSREYTDDELFMQNVLLASETAEQNFINMIKNFLGSFKH